MSTHRRDSGIELTLPDDITLEEVTPPPGDATVRGRRSPGRPARGRGLPRGPVPMPGGAEPGEPDPVVDAMGLQGLQLMDTFDLRAAGGGVTRRRGDRRPARAEVHVLEDEDAAVLLEQDGVYTWRMPTTTEVVSPPARRGPEVVRPRRRAVFDLEIEQDAAPDVRRRRGPVSDFLVGRVRAYVFRFVARAAAGRAIAFLERNAREGLVRMEPDDPAAWSGLDRLADLRLPTDRPARILLFVHGTFSSTVGSYGALGLTPWGRAFLGRARGRYDAVLGYDHRTLGPDPLDNATGLLARLEEGGARLEIDAIAFSRGALVLRSLIEHLLPRSTAPVRVRRAIFVGGTNGGTHLAAPDHWKQLIDLYTNLFAAGARVLAAFAPATVAAMVARQSIETLGALVKALATQALEEGHVPGLAAMAPEGPFVQELNRTQPGQPSAADALYYVVSSEFQPGGVLAGGGAPEFPTRLAQWVLDGLADAFMDEPNDLVVPTSSMTRIDDSADFVKDHWRFGGNPHVYHTVYFTREEVARVLGRWLGLTPRADEPDEDLPAGADDRIVTVSAGDTVTDILLEIERSLPTFVVAERDTEWGEVLRYAYRAEELIELGRHLGARTGEVDLEEGARGTPLEMHEGTSSPEIGPDAHGEPPVREGPSGSRLVAMRGAVPRAVVERGPAMPSSLELSDVASRADRPAFRGRRGSLRRRAPDEAPAGEAPGEHTLGFEAPAPAEETLADLAVARGEEEEVAGGPQPAHADEPATVFVAAEMPESVPVDTTVSLTVTVSQDRIEIQTGPTRDVASVEIQTDLPLVVQVIPKRLLEVEGPDRTEIRPGGGRVDLVFDLRASAQGAGEVWVVVRQGPQSLATLRLHPTVTAAPGASGRRVRSATEASKAEAGLRPHPVLYIYEWEGPEGFRYKFTLQKGPADSVSDDSDLVRGSREDYVAGIYEEIESRWLSNEDDFASFEEELRAYGGLLLGELVPPSIQHALWEQRDELKAIQVMAEEPFIPWELVHLKPPPGPGGQPSSLPDERHFLAEKGLVRWLHNRGRAPQRIAVRSGRSFYVVPEYPHPDYRLPEAQAEIPYLEQELRARPVECEVGAIRSLLRGPGKLDLFHFSGHGEAETGNSLSAQLMLGGTVERGSWVPRYLKADLVSEHGQLRDGGGSRPIVVLNACQTGRAGWRLTSIGGFADSFLRAGAGVFVGSLWSVGDPSARSFSEAFYRALKDGSPLAEAATAARLAAAAEREGSWLSYVVYGYPYATVSVME